MPLPEPIQLPSQELHRASGHNPVQLYSQHDQNQPPVKTAKSTVSITRPALTKRIVPTTLKRYSRQANVTVLANGIAKFPVWRQGERLQKKTQPIPIDGNTIGNNTTLDTAHITQHTSHSSLHGTHFTLAHAPIYQFHAENQNQHFVDCAHVVDGHQSDMGRFQTFADREAAHGCSTSSGSTGKSDGSLSDDFEDKTNPTFTLLETKTLIRYFPVTFPTTSL